MHGVLILTLQLTDMVILRHVAILVNVKDCDMGFEHLRGTSDHEINDLVVPELAAADLLHSRQILRALILLRVALRIEERRELIHARRQMIGEAITERGHASLLCALRERRKADDERGEEAVAIADHLLEMQVVLKESLRNRHFKGV